MAKPTQEGRTGDTTRKAKLYDGSNWGSRQERMQQEAVERPELLQRLQSEVDRLFPGDELAELRADIMERSVNVPQYGDHHNEGALMSRHLEAILENIKALKAGQFLDSVPGEIRPVLQEVARTHGDTLERYVFLHDIGKADSLHLRFADDDARDAWLAANGVTPEEGAINKKMRGVVRITWEQWQQVCPPEKQTDPVALDEWLATQGITEKNGVAYLKHEVASRDAVKGREAELGVDPLVTKLIEKHSIVYQFSGVSAQKFREHFGQFSKDEMRLLLAVNLIDTSSSVGPNGVANLNNYRDIVDSYYNSQICTGVEKLVKPGDQTPSELDDKKVGSALKALLTQNTRIEGDVADIATDIKDACLRPKYNVDALRAKLQADLSDLFEAGTLTDSDLEKIIGAIDPETGMLNEKAIGPVKGKLRRDVPRLTAVLESPGVQR